MAKKKQKDFEWSGETRRVIPLKANHCYIFDHKGKTHHINRDSDEFLALAVDVNENTNGRIEAEMKNLGWDVEFLQKENQ